MDKSRASAGQRLKDEDRRRSPRKEVQIEASLRTLAGEFLATGVIRNASLGGVFIQTSDPPPAGAELQIDISLPVEPYAIRCMAVVMWSSNGRANVEPGNSGIGVRLWQLGPTELKFLMGLLSQAPASKESEP